MGTPEICETEIELNVGAEKPGTLVDDRLDACPLTLDDEAAGTLEIRENVIGLNVGAASPETRLDDRPDATEVCALPLRGEAVSTLEAREVSAELDISEGKILEGEMAAVVCDDLLNADIPLTLVPDAEAGLRDDKIGVPVEVTGETDAMVGKIWLPNEEVESLCVADGDVCVRPPSVNGLLWIGDARDGVSWLRDEADSDPMSIELGTAVLTPADVTRPELSDELFGEVTAVWKLGVVNERTGFTELVTVVLRPGSVARLRVDDMLD